MSDDDFSLFGPGGFDDLPDEVRELLESLSGGDPDQLAARLEQLLPDLAGQVQAQMQAMMASGATGPVDWNVARQVGFQLAADGDRSPTDQERERLARALQLAEHWLDGSDLPAPPQGTRLVVGRRTEWLEGALEALAPLIEPVAAARARAMAALAPTSADDAMLPPELADLLGDVDLGVMVRTMASGMSGLQAGMALGNLSRQLLAGHDLGIPTAPRGLAVAIAVNQSQAFDEWGLDLEEVAVAAMLHEEAHRRLFHAVPWLRAHVESLVAQFANGTDVDPERLQDLLSDAMLGVDPEDPQSMAAAMQRAGRFRLEPTAQQQRVLQRLQGVTDLVRAWARHEALAAADGRLPSLAAIDEVLRRRRAEVGDGEQVLADLLGLQLTGSDPDVADGFIAAVVAARGSAGLHEALAHPENLPDAGELAEPSRWLVRMAAADAIPDDPGALFGGLGDAPVEESADRRLHARRDEQAGDDRGDGGDGDPSDEDDPPTS